MPVQGWGGAWGVIPWGGVQSIEARIVQRILTALKASSGVTSFTGSGSGARIYGAYPQTIQDWILPAISIRLIFSGGRLMNPVHLDPVQFDIDLWLNGIGKNAAVWDDMMTLHEAVIDALHQQTLYDRTIGARILDMRLIQEGPQEILFDSILHHTGRWSTLASYEGGKDSFGAS